MYWRVLRQNAVQALYHTAGQDALGGASVEGVHDGEQDSISFSLQRKYSCFLTASILLLQYGETKPLIKSASATLHNTALNQVMNRYL